MASAFIIHLQKIIVYTPLFPTEAKDSNSVTDDNSFSLLVSNVPMDHDDKENLVRICMRGTRNKHLTVLQSIHRNKIQHVNCHTSKDQYQLYIIQLLEGIVLRLEYYMSQSGLIYKVYFCLYFESN